MVIGIHAKGAFQYERTGVEEYVYQLIKHLAVLDESSPHQFILYTPPFSYNNLFLPKNFRIKTLYSPFFWTRGRLSLKMFFDAPDTLFMPANFLPLFYPRRNVVTIHGVEFEHFPDAYPPYLLEHLRAGTKTVVQKADKIITVSYSTKNDLINFYNADPAKIEVIHLGVNPNTVYPNKYPPFDDKYILYIGRLEKRKNVHNIIQAFEILKERHKIPHKLVLVGGKGYGFSEISAAIENCMHKEDIFLTGYISHEEKDSFIQYADLFVFPTLYEGFGMPILEAQSREIPVVTSNVPSITEIAGSGALFVDPLSVEQITDAVYKVVSDEDIKKELIDRGLENAKRFSWFKCAKQTLEVLIRA